MGMINKIKDMAGYYAADKFLFEYRKAQTHMANALKAILDLKVHVPPYEARRYDRTHKRMRAIVKDWNKVEHLREKEHDPKYDIIIDLGGSSNMCGRRKKDTYPPTPVAPSDEGKAEVFTVNGPYSVIRAQTGDVQRITSDYNGEQAPHNEGDVYVSFGQSNSYMMGYLEQVAKNLPGEFSILVQGESDQVDRGRFKVVRGSQSSHDCCFQCTIVDTTQPYKNVGGDESQKFVSVCEVNSAAEADFVCEAMNALDKARRKS